jgi:hypothetical protein
MPHNPLADRIIPLYERHAQVWHGRRLPTARMEAGWLARFGAESP